jgi:hypothetical protein
VEITPTSDVPAAPPELADIVSGARASALEFVKSQEAARAAAPSPEPPAADPAAPLTTSPVAAPVPSPDPGQQAPPAAEPAAATIDVSAFSPEAKRFLEMVSGGGPITAEVLNRAAERGLQFNNALGKRGVPAQPLADPSAAAQAATSQPSAVPSPASPEPPVDLSQVTNEDIRNEALRLANTDPECRSLDSEAGPVLADIAAIDRDHPSLAADIQFFDRAAREAAERDPALAEEYREKLSELRAVKARRTELSLQERDLRDRFYQRVSQYEQRVVSHLRQQHEQRAAAEAAQAELNRHVEEMEKAWPVAATAALQAHGLPDSMLAKLNKRASESALANLSLGMRVQDVRAHLDSHAKELKDEMVEYHRLQAIEHGRLAHVRTDVAAPAPGVSPGVQTKAPDNAPLSLSEIQRQARLDARTRVLGR